MDVKKRGLDISVYSKIWLVLFLLAYAFIHSMLWASNPPDSDPINFVTALHHYDISVDSPHPPGYPAYVGLAKLASSLVGDMQAYQLVNLLLVLVTIISIYLALEKLQLKNEAWIAALIIATHPLMFSATLMQESYMSDACFGSVLFAWVLFQFQNRHLFLLGIAVIFYFFGLFRVVTDILLLPFLGVLVWNLKNKNIKSAIFAMTCAIVCCGLAWLTTIYVAGGYEIYQEAAKRVMGEAVKASSVFAGAEISSHAKMLAKLVFWLMFYSWPIIALRLILRRLKKSPPQGLSALVILAWVMPPLAFYALIYYLKPLYLLVFLPAYAICLALLVCRLGENFSQNTVRLALCAVVGLQLVFFFLPNTRWGYSLYRSSYAYIRDQDVAWEQARELTTNMPQKGTLFVWGDNPNISTYMLRLLNVPEHVAIVSPQRHTIQFFSAKDMHWQPEKSLEHVPQNSYERVAVLSQLNGNFRLKIIEISNTKAKSLADFDWYGVGIKVK